MSQSDRLYRRLVAALTLSLSLFFCGCHAEKKGPLASRAFVTRLTVAPFRPFRFLDGSKAWTNLDQLRQHRRTGNERLFSRSPPPPFLLLVAGRPAGVFRRRAKTFPQPGGQKANQNEPRSLAREISVRGFNNHPANARFVAPYKAN